MTFSRRIGDRSLRLLTEARGSQWIARAQREDNGDPYGIECVAATEDEALARLTQWLEWQAEHAAALTELQRAERAYHRTIAGSAFVSQTEGPGAVEMQKESLAAVEAARDRLDQIRARRPE